LQLKEFENPELQALVDVSR